MKLDGKKGKKGKSKKVTFALGKGKKGKSARSKAANAKKGKMKKESPKKESPKKEKEGEKSRQCKQKFGLTKNRRGRNFECAQRMAFNRARKEISTNGKQSPNTKAANNIPKEMWSLVESDHNAAFKLLKTHDFSWDAVMLSEENKELTTSEEHGNRVWLFEDEIVQRCCQQAGTKKKGHRRAKLMIFGLRQNNNVRAALGANIGPLHA